MLYVTTRSNDDAYTAHRALVNDIGPDGGYFAPFKLPYFDEAAIAKLKEINFNQTVSDIINCFFSVGLTGYDLDLSIGKNLVRVNGAGRRIIVAELWHNLGGSLHYIEDALLKKLSAKAGKAISAQWTGIAVKIAVLFGVYGQMLRENIVSVNEHIDFSVRDDAFTTILALWYCREMGLPINMLICTCLENSTLWDFINRGTLQTGNLNEEFAAGAERFLFAVFGCDVAKEFSVAVNNSCSFTLSEANMQQLNRGLFCSVAGKDRAKSVINSVYRTNEYIIDDKTAQCYGGLQDFRAKTGDSNITIILAENTPFDCLHLISDATGLDTQNIKDIIKQN